MSYHNYRACMSIVKPWRIQVPSKSEDGKEYLVMREVDPMDGEHWSCECKAYQFRKTCSHIKKAKEQWCGWHEFIDGGYNDLRDKGKCPRCKGEIEVQRWAV